MVYQRLKASCKLISVSLGLFTSYFSYQYQQNVSFKFEKTFNQNFNDFQNWMKWKSNEALNITEHCLIHYCHVLSTSSLFYRTDMISLPIFLANSRNLFLHELGVKLLASIAFPDGVDILAILKKCEYTALVGLARTNQIDPKWLESMKLFLPNQTIDWLHNSDDKYLFVVKGRLDNLLKDIREKVPDQREDCTSWLYQSITYDRLPEDPVPSLMSDFCTERDTLEIRKEEPNLLQRNLRSYLDILKQYSNDKVIIANSTISNEILDTVLDIMYVFSDKKYVQLLCGNIVANLAVNDRNRKAIVKKGFLSIFLAWKKQEATPLKVVADRALYNLDSFRDGFTPLSEGVYILYPNNRLNETTPEVDIVLVHGVHGSPFHTWRQNDHGDKATYTQCWPKDWLPDDFPKSRVLCVQYESALSDWLRQCPMEKEKYSLDKQAENIKKTLKDIGVGSRPVVWVCHSMGGIITKKILMSSGNFVKNNSEDILQSTFAVIFYSTPHLGSPIANQSERARYVLFPSVEVHELSGRDNKLEHLHNQFTDLKEQFNISCVDFGESLPLKLPYVKFKMMVVPPTSCNVGYGRFILLENTHHHETCKPVSKFDTRYTVVVEMIKAATENGKEVIQQMP